MGHIPAGHVITFTEVYAPVFPAGFLGVSEAKAVEGGHQPLSSPSLTAQSPALLILVVEQWASCFTSPLSLFPSRKQQGGG